jgi:putative spermidine/putrescine transport system permease protein
MRRRRGSIAWWLVFLLAVLYFFLPLVATLDFALKAKPPLSAFTNAVSDPKFFTSLLYSLVIGVVTIIVSLALIVPTAYWVQLKVPRARSAVEFVTLLPFVIPAVVLVFGLIRVYSQPPLPFTHTDIGSSVLLAAGYVVLSLPYMYRAVDTGLRSIDIRSLTEAAQSMGAGWLTIIVRVILPNLRVALLSGAFLTLAIVLGEFTIANFLARPAFGPYLNLLSQQKAYEPAAVALISFGLTWLAMIAIAFIGRDTRTRIEIGGAH